MNYNNETEAILECLDHLLDDRSLTGESNPHFHYRDATDGTFHAYDWIGHELSTYTEADYKLLYVFCAPLQIGAFVTYPEDEHGPACRDIRQALRAEIIKKCEGVK